MRGAGPQRNLRLGPVADIAVDHAMRNADGRPLLDAAELVVRASVRAAMLFPEWASSLVDHESVDMDHLAKMLVAHNAHLLGES